MRGKQYAILLGKKAFYHFYEFCARFSTPSVLIGETFAILLAVCVSAFCQFFFFEKKFFFQCVILSEVRSCIAIDLITVFRRNLDGQAKLSEITVFVWESDAK